MDKITVIGMDLGDKNLKAVMLAADGTEIRLGEVSNAPAQVHVATVAKERLFCNG